MKVILVFSALLLLGDLPMPMICSGTHQGVQGKQHIVKTYEAHARMTAECHCEGWALLPNSGIGEIKASKKCD